MPRHARDFGQTSQLIDWEARNEPTKGKHVSRAAAILLLVAARKELRRPIVVWEEEHRENQFQGWSTPDVAL